MSADHLTTASPKPPKDKSSVKSVTTSVAQLSQILVFGDLVTLDLEHLQPYTQLQHYSKGKNNNAGGRSPA